MPGQSKMNKQDIIEYYVFLVDFAGDDLENVFCNRFNIMAKNGCIICGCAQKVNCWCCKNCASIWSNSFKKIYEEIYTPIWKS